MDYFEIIKRAAKTAWHKRALWVFGILLALTSGSASSGLRFYNFGGGNRAGSSSSRLPWGQGFQMPRITNPFRAMPAWTTGTIIAVIVAAILIILALVILSAIVRYVSRTALIKMVDQNEQIGSTGTVGDGFKKGWSKPAWRMFLIDLLIWLPFAVIGLALLAIGLSPLLLLGLNRMAINALAIVLAIGLSLIVLAVLIIVGLLLSVLTELAYREAALAGARTMPAVSSAYALIRRRFKDVGLMWLLLFGVRIGWGLMMIPVFFILALLALVIAGAPALALYAATQSAAAALILGIPVALIVIGAPALFLAGLYTTFDSAAWTLTYRELALRPAPDAPALAEQPAQVA